MRLGGVTYTAGGTFPVKTPLAICAQGASGTAKLFATRQGLVINSGSGPGAAPAANWRIGQNGDYGDGGVAEVSLFLVARDPFPDILARSLVDNPWQIFVPRAKKYQVGFPPAITYTLTAANAAFTETGNAASFLRGRVVSAAVAAFTETGNATGLLRNRAVTLAVAAFSLSGLPAIVARGRFITAVKGSFTATGAAAAFTLGRFISAALGAFGLTAQPANFFRYRVVSAVTAAFSLSGVASALSQVRALAAATAAFALVGKVVALSKSALGGASAAQIWQYEILPGVTAEQLLRLMASVLFGKVSGAGTSTEVFRDINDTKDRVTVTVDASGNRTGVTLDSS